MGDAPAGGDNEVPGPNSPRFAPNILNLLADMGVRASDDPRIERLLWSGPEADAEAARAVAQICACMVAYNFGAEGKVTPLSCYRGFEGFSFGRTKVPSPFSGDSRRLSRRWRVPM